MPSRFSAWPENVCQACVKLMIPCMFLLVGCGENRGTLPISGKVTYQGKPVANARVVFVSKSGGRSADGLTNSDGIYRLGTFMAGDGVLPGEYLVTVSSTDVDVSQPPSTEITDGAAYEPPKPEEAKSKLPAKYQSPNQSGLKTVVEVGGPKEFNFTLTD